MRRDAQGSSQINSSHLSVDVSNTYIEGFQAAADQCVRRFARGPATRRIAFLLARHAACETELTPFQVIRL